MKKYIGEFDDFLLEEGINERDRDYTDRGGKSGFKKKRNRLIKDRTAITNKYDARIDAINKRIDKVQGIRDKKRASGKRDVADDYNKQLKILNKQRKNLRKEKEKAVNAIDRKIKRSMTFKRYI